MHPQNLLAAISLGAAFLLSSGCAPDQKSTRGFVFPEGDIAQGRSTFVELKCTRCHQVHLVGGLPRPVIPASKVIVLGGEVNETKTYGDLITAIIHPSESVTAQASGRTANDPDMPIINDEMTVEQMLDLVTFLSPQYKKLQPLYQDYYIQ